MRYNFGPSDMPGILYVVATPIGNLEDVTMRALRILREVTLIAAEDTRRTAKLLQHYSISTPATSLHGHNEHAKTPGLLARLRHGDSIALVSDAGTPAVSDPGARLVSAAHLEGIAVRPVPGPSAVIAAISGAGLPVEGFTFAGFPPNRSNPRDAWFRELASHRFPLVLYEAPHRIHATLGAIHRELGERDVAVGRELTKVHENLVVRPISRWLSSPPPEQGEFVLVIFPAAPTVKSGNLAIEPKILAAEFWRITKSARITRREALRIVARQFHVPTREVFAAVEAHPFSGK